MRTGSRGRARPSTAAWIAGLALALLATFASAAVPFWGARQSSSVDTPPDQLKPGEWIWGGDIKTMGPMTVIVSLTEQRGYVYRNGVLIAVTTVSTGKKGHETPTGVFTILQKDKDHRSSKYNSAPMPYQERLTWDGIALHAGGLPGYPESHGCVHMPSEFARLLFDATTMGMTVVISEDGASPMAMVHPSPLSPIRADTGVDAVVPPLENGVSYRWHPELAPEGPLSLVLSRSDQRLVVMRNGIEIGRSRVLVREPEAITGTHAYVMGSGYMDGTFPQFPGGHAPQWQAIAVPGHEADAGGAVKRETIEGLTIPPEFIALVYPLLTPGTVLVATDAHIIPQTNSGNKLEIINADPPDETR